MNFPVVSVRLCVHGLDIVAQGACSRRGLAPAADEVHEVLGAFGGEAPVRDVLEGAAGEGKAIGGGGCGGGGGSEGGGGAAAVAGGLELKLAAGVLGLSLVNAVLPVVGVFWQW